MSKECYATQTEGHMAMFALLPVVTSIFSGSVDKKLQKAATGCGHKLRLQAKANVKSRLFFNQSSTTLDPVQPLR